MNTANNNQGLNNQNCNTSANSLYGPRLVVYCLSAIIVADTSILPPSPSALSQAGQFVWARVQNMAPFLRLPTKLLLLVFDLSALLTIMRPFSYASPAGRRRHLLRVGQWPLPPLHDLIKLVRSLCLLRHYSAQEGRAQLGLAPQDGQAPPC